MNSSFPVLEQASADYRNPFAEQIAAQVYTDVSGARRLLVQLYEQLAQAPDEELMARALLMRGNLQNLEYDFVSAEETLQLALEAARGVGDKVLEVEATADLVGVLLNLDKVAEAAAVLDSTEELVEPAAQHLLWRLAVRGGFVQLRLASPDDALKSFKSASEQQPALDSAVDHVKDAYYGALLHAGLGRVYTLGGDLIRATRAYANVVELCSQFNMRGRLPYHYLDLGGVYMAAGQRERAIENFEQAISSSGPNDKHALASANANLGYYAFEDAAWSIAVRRFDEAEHHYRTSGKAASSDLARLFLWRAKLARAQELDAEVEEALISSLRFALEGEELEVLAQAYHAIAEHYALRGSYEDAYMYRLRYEDTQEELHDLARRQSLNELTLRHEVEERRHESQVLKLEAARLQLKALRAQMNPHFIFNALNAIQESIVANQASEAAGHLAHFARLMRQSLDYSEREVITLEEEVEFLTNYLELNKKLRFQDSFSYNIEVDDELEDDLVGLPAMLLQPFIENAVEHGIRQVEDGRIAIRFAADEEDEDLLHVTIVDNGIGRQLAAQKRQRKDPEHKSMGTTITQHRLDLLNAGSHTPATVAYTDLKDDSGAPTGTQVDVRIPIRWQ